MPSSQEVRLDEALGVERRNGKTEAVRVLVVRRRL